VAGHRKRVEEVSYQEQEAKALRKQGANPQEMCKMLRISEERLEQLLLGDWVVRVVLPKDEAYDRRSLLTGFVQAGYVEIHRDDADGMCFDILPPTYEVSERWAMRTVVSMTDRGFNAAKAPRWRD